MQKRVLLLVLFCALFSQVFSQSMVQLVSANPEETILNIHVEKTSVNPAERIKIKGENASFILRPGAPDLQKISTALIIPDLSEMKVEILSSQYYEIPNIEIAPSKGNLYRDIIPDQVQGREGKEYQKNEFFPGVLADLQTPYILRDFRAQSLWLYPLQYNPVTKVLRVYTDFQVKVAPSGISRVNTYARRAPLTSVESEFASVYRHQFINYEAIATYTPVSEEGSMLILCPPAFLSAMQPFVLWKKQRGIPVEIVDLTTIGNTPALIRDFINQYYIQNHTLKFVVLVGDNAQLPCMTYNGNPSDNAYAYLLGTDSYPEVFMGRFSGENVQEIQTIVSRSIEYEKMPSDTGTWYRNAVCIASDEGPGDDNEMDYEHEHNIRTKLMGYTYTNVAELYDGTHNTGGYTDAPGNPVAGDFSLLVNNGVGLVNYTGHGGPQDIVTTGHNVQDVTGLTNSGKYLFLWEVGCVSGEFMNTTCYAEAWIRATHPVNGSLTGAAAVLASTINQSWDPPMEGQDAMNDILTESISGNIKRSFGGISFNGCMQMNDVYGSNGEEMTDTWTLFGDPSIMMFTNTPQSMTVTHNPSVMLGSSNLAVNGSIDGAKVSLTQDNEIIGSGTIASGSVLIAFTQALTSVSDITVTVTAYNTMPYIGTVNVTVPNGPFVIAHITGVDDPTGNNNQSADNGEIIALNMQWQNVGLLTANNVSATLTSSSPDITVMNGNAACGNVNASSSVPASSVFQIQVHNDVADGTIAPLEFSLTDNSGNTWTSYGNLLLNAPKLQVLSLEVQDAAGNNNGFIDPGEAVTIVVHNLNAGHNATTAASATLLPGNPLITVAASPVSVGTIAAGLQGDAVFSVTAGASIQKGTAVQFDYTIQDGAYQAQSVFTLIIAPNVINFEPNNTTAVTWLQGGASPWFTSTLLPYEGSNCQQSGDIANNQSSEMSFTYTAAQDDSIHFYKKVSTEEGWDFLYFYIDNIEQGKWSGEVDWERISYPVSAGTHNFLWKYEKDGFVSEGEDAAFVDYILLPTDALSSVEESFFAERMLEVFPNPANQTTHIRFITQPGEKVMVSLFDMNGRAIQTQVPPQYSGKINLPFDTENLAGGLYLLSVSIDDKRITRKLMIVKN
ncbi:MAG: T9SS type A sorting domain-containing protein [Bacteroidia bacterium]|nr:T9SS type A sorting domain-containing protein [Bacteroidia bacterium]